MQIRYSKKITKNLGNFESLALEISIEDGVDYESDETYDEAYLRIRSLVNKNLKQELSNIKPIATRN